MIIPTELVVCIFSARRNCTTVLGVIADSRAEFGQILGGVSYNVSQRGIGRSNLTYLEPLLVRVL